MPKQKRRFNVRFPPSRIKKIMQKDTEVGRIAMAVPVIICLSMLGVVVAGVTHLQICKRSARALEMFLKSLLTKTCLITQSNLSTVVSVAHMKQCIESEKLFHFLKDLVEQATTTATQKDNRGMSIWPLYRSKCHEIPVKKATEAAEMVPRRSLDSLDNNSSSSESELYICL